MERFTGIIGIVIILLLAYLWSNNRRMIIFNDNYYKSKFVYDEWDYLIESVFGQVKVADLCKMRKESDLADKISPDDKSNFLSKTTHPPH